MAPPRPGKIVPTQLLCLPNGLKVYNYDAIIEDYANDKWS